MLLVFAWFACLFFFGTSYITAGFLAKYTIPLEYTTFYRVIVASVILLIFILATRRRILIKKNEILPSILTSVSQLSVLFVTYGTKYTISGIIPCVTILQIFVAELLSSVVEKRKMKKNVLISGCLGFIGIILLCHQQLTGFDSVDTKNTIIGVVFAFMSTFAAAAGNMIYDHNKKILLQMSRSTFLFYNCLFAGMAFFLFGLVIRPIDCLFDISAIDVKYCFVLIWLSVTTTIIALFALYYIIEKQGAVKATYMNFVLPIISMVISTIFENFSWDIITVIGMAILLYSVWLGCRQKV